MAAATPNASIAALTQVRAAETETDERLAAARRLAEETIHRLKSEAEDAIASARAQADGERVHRVEEARADADREAATIVADGERAVARLGRSASVPADRRAAVLAAVLGDFAGK